MSKALARRPKHSRSLGHPRKSRENPISPLGTGLLVVGGGAALGGLVGGLMTGTGGIVGGMQQGIGYAAIGGLVVGLLSQPVREGALAVAGIGLIADVGLGIGQTAAAALAPKAA